MKLLEALPASLAGQAKWSFDQLKEEDKDSKETFFQGLRARLDPTSEKRNKDLFIAARRGLNESMIAFIDRCRMYI